MMLHVPVLSQRLSVQEVPPLLNGDSSSRSQQQQQQQRSSQSDILSQSLIGLSSSNTSQQNGNAHSSSSASPAHSQPAVSIAGLQSSLCTSSHSSLQGLTPPLTAPHSPPLPHSAPLSRALTPVLSTAHHTVSSSPTALNVLKGPELYSTSTLPLPRRQTSDTRMGFLGGSDFVFAIFESFMSGSCFSPKSKDKNKTLYFTSGNEICLRSIKIFPWHLTLPITIT